MTGQIAGYNTGDIASGLPEPGLAAGDTAFVHSSLRSLGRVEGGPETVVAAFLDVLGRHVGHAEFRRFFAEGNDQIWGRERSPGGVD